MAKKSHAYIWQSVIGFGFLSGLWTAVGIDPEGVILTLVGRTIDTFYPDRISVPVRYPARRSCSCFDLPGLEEGPCTGLLR